MSDSDILNKINSVQQWYHQIEVRPGMVTPGINKSRETLELLDLPSDCSGLRALDLGTRDGFFAFELERRGAQVLAMDYMPSRATGFDVARELLGSKVQYVQENIYNLSSHKYGRFDIVLFLGLIYHLPDPMFALRIVRTLCRDELYLESHVIDNAFLLPNGTLTPLSSVSEQLVNIPIMPFYPNDSLNNDLTNYWGPNLVCLEMMLAENGFTVISKKPHGGRGIFKCRVAQDERHEYLMDIATGARSPEV